MLETAEVERWRRLTSAMLRHAAQDDPAAFAQVVEILTDATAQLPSVAQQLTAKDARTGGVSAPGHSWADIGYALGITRTAAHKRYGARRA